MEVSNVFLPPFKANPERNIGLAYLNAADEATFHRALELGSEWVGEDSIPVIVVFSNGGRGGEEGLAVGSEWARFFFHPQSFSRTAGKGGIPSIPVTVDFFGMAVV